MSSPYVLLIKKEGQAFSKYRGRTFRLSNIQPHTVDEVVVALKDKKGKRNKITTFRDINGDIIERSFNFFDSEKVVNKLYKKTQHTLTENETCTATSIQTFSLMKNIVHVYKDYEKQFRELGKPSILWTNNCSETHYVSKKSSTGELFHTQTALKNLDTPRCAKCSFIQYESKTEPEKHLTFKVNVLNNKLSDIKTKNIKFPKSDTFLTMRAIDIETAKEFLCNHFIKEQKLTKLKLKVNTNYEKNDGKLVALYNDEDGSININKKYEFKSKHKLVQTVRHEVEHAWQWFLHARNTGGNNPRAMELAKKFGKIRKGKLQELADKCSRAITNYVQYSDDVVAYRKNWVEKSANKVGLQAAMLYDKQGQPLRKQFTHVPREMF